MAEVRPGDTMQIPAGDGGSVIATLTALTCELTDGRTGYYQRSNSAESGCLAAAVATATQTPLEELPPMVGLNELFPWTEENGWKVDVHKDSPPIDAPIWIGCTPVLVRGSDRRGWRHTLVFAYGELVFDPAAGWIYPGSDIPRQYEIAHGISFQRKENE